LSDSYFLEIIGRGSVFLVFPNKDFRELVDCTRLVIRLWYVHELNHMCINEFIYLILVSIVHLISSDVCSSWFVISKNICFGNLT
jgi:hypothetical protein